MIRALQFVSAKAPIHFFEAENKCYRYWYTPQVFGFEGVLKIQIKRSELAKFRATDAGRNVSRFVDMFEVGGGWYEVRSADMTEWNKLFGTSSDGLKMWVRELNRWNLGHVNANQPEVRVQYVKPSAKIVHRVEVATAGYQVNPNKLQQLAAKFGRN